MIWLTMVLLILTVVLVLLTIVLVRSGVQPSEASPPRIGSSLSTVDGGQVSTT